VKDLLKKAFGSGQAAPGRRFEGKSAVVTGASSGIGLATAIAFATEGARVALIARREAEGKKALEKVQSHSPESIFIVADVRDGEKIKGAFAKVRDAFGSIDAALNNAGAMHARADLGGINEEDFDRVLDTNLKGTWFCIKEEVPLMERHGGAIVNMSSMSGLVATQGLGAYVASKHAIVGMTRVAALDYVEKNIRINAVCPGFVRTDMTSGVEEQWLKRRVPMQRWIEADEIAETVLYLCSDAARSIIGQAIVVDGGATLRSG
jgi:NAD(P)-dependent dehydrogenase (short-subunit alcohol dehydrogenase family)